jgi:hypothetical protein
MNEVFSPRLLIGWIAGAVAVFAASLFLLGTGDVTGPEKSGPSTYSRSAIGHMGIAEVLQRLGIPVVKSAYNSLEKLASGGVLVLAEPRPSAATEEAMRTLLKADAILLVLPKWAGRPSDQVPGYIRDTRERSPADARWALRLVAPQGEVERVRGALTWTTNAIGPPPNLGVPVQLVRGEGLTPLIAAEQGMLLGEVREGGRRIWVLADPDVISNHGLARAGNATLAVAIVQKLREPAPRPGTRAAAKGKSSASPKRAAAPASRAEQRLGPVVFDETVHGYSASPTSPFLLAFRFPLVIATVQGLIAAALLLWATMARFGAPQPAPPALSAGRGGLLANMAKLIERSGHQPVMVARYVEETVREVARALHAPRGLSGDGLAAWLQRVGAARGVDVDCRALLSAVRAGGRGRRRDALARIARDTHRWKEEILNGRARDPRGR